MFEHLDDPEPFVPDAAFRQRVVTRGRRLRRRRRLLGSAVAVVLLLVGSAAMALTVLDRKLDRIERVDMASVGDADPPVGPARIVLFAGVDDDGGLDPSRAGGGKRSDTVIVTRVDPKTHVLTVLPLPRDLWVDVPDHGMGRLNSAMSIGGPDLLVRTVERLLDIEVDHYVETDFIGARDIGDALGGLRLRFASPVRDRMTGFEVDDRCTTLDGKGLLAMARSRHLEVLGESGRWYADPTGDLGRIDRQQAVAEALLHRITDLDAHDVGRLTDLVDAAGRSLVLDSGLTNTELLRIVRDVARSEVHRVDLRVTDVVHGGAAVLEPTTDLGALGDAVRRGVPPHDPKDRGPAPPSPVGIVPTPC